eukprot:gnl/TRDRNA2_/TRDRNA2_182947_c0_seq1.p1 gnl/TRDRNA2_/TRDRNA2_182947_c0~~gnl/TRDRNA2_/TRDRNA2_182947_c0_seq1.p1  ORF type:complete len:155 (+),score=38.29 gnl/TRDRNA2_/TRDRNA2_182947_c0_seq1:64-528(+)
MADFFMTKAPNGQTWETVLETKFPQADGEGFLSGAWGCALVEAARYMHKNPDYVKEYTIGSPTDQVVEKLCSKDEDLRSAARSLESAAKMELKNPSDDALAARSDVFGLPKGSKDPDDWKIPPPHPDVVARQLVMAQRFAFAKQLFATLPSSRY